MLRNFAHFVHPSGHPTVKACRQDCRWRQRHCSLGFTTTAGIACAVASATDRLSSQQAFRWTTILGSTAIRSVDSRCEDRVSPPHRVPEMVQSLLHFSGEAAGNLVNLHDDLLDSLGAFHRQAI